jgi:hypothetical protein
MGVTSGEKRLDVRTILRWTALRGGGSRTAFACDEKAGSPIQPIRNRLPDLMRRNAVSSKFEIKKAANGQVHLQPKKRATVRPC